LNVVGLRRKGLSRESLSAVKAAYRTLYASGVSLAEAIAKIEVGPRVPEVDAFIAFLKNTSPRGLCRPDAKSRGDDPAESSA
jgi:UDP-N-acetylglucosamine acyltransferase